MFNSGSCFAHRKARRFPEGAGYFLLNHNIFMCGEVVHRKRSALGWLARGLKSPWMYPKTRSAEEEC